MSALEIIFAMISSIGVILGGIWIMLQKSFNLGEKNNKLSEIDNRTCKAQCELHDNEINIVKQDLKEIKADIVAIKSILVMKHKNVSDIFSIKNSPRKLNANGIKLFGDIQGEVFLKKNKAFFFSKIDELKPKTALDVENAANLVCSVNTNNDIFNGMKNFVYNSPTYMLKDSDGNDKPYDISLPDICFVLSIPLRDMYLEEHKNILQE